MPSLRELQRGFSAATLFGDSAAVARLAIVAGKLDPQTRVAIYRGNILANYRKVLAASYPVVRRLVGSPFFDTATDRFVLGHPSRHGDVNHYGGDYAVFLASYPPARELSYLADVARLEWAIDQANIAADAAPLDVAALATVAPDALAELRFSLHPAARLIASPFPILRIWQVNQPEHEGDDLHPLLQALERLAEIERDEQKQSDGEEGEGDGGDREAGEERRPAEDRKSVV